MIITKIIAGNGRDGYIIARACTAAIVERTDVNEMVMIDGLYELGHIRGPGQQRLVGGRFARTGKMGRSVGLVRASVAFIHELPCKDSRVVCIAAHDILDPLTVTGNPAFAQTADVADVRPLLVAVLVEAYVAVSEAVPSSCSLSFTHTPAVSQDRNHSKAMTLGDRQGVIECAPITYAVCGGQALKKPRPEDPTLAARGAVELT